LDLLELLLENLDATLNGFRVVALVLLEAFDLLLKFLDLLFQALDRFAA
jgi:hypothetical protein